MNIGTVLVAAGLSFNNVVKTTISLADINDYAAMNSAYSEIFSKNCPARTTFQVTALPIGALVVIDAIAAVGNIVDLPNTEYAAHPALHMVLSFKQ